MCDYQKVAGYESNPDLFNVHNPTGCEHLYWVTGSLSPRFLLPIYPWYPAPQPPDQMQPPLQLLPPQIDPLHRIQRGAALGELVQLKSSGKVCEVQKTSKEHQKNLVSKHFFDSRLATSSRAAPRKAGHFVRISTRHAAVARRNR